MMIYFYQFYVILVILEELKCYRCVYTSFFRRNKFQNLSAKSSVYQNDIPNLIKMTSTNSSKAHKNKYKQFSKNLNDPLLIQLPNITDMKKPIITQNLGKTVPIQVTTSSSNTNTKLKNVSSIIKSSSGSNSNTKQIQQNISKTLKTKIKNKINSINPSDPYSFGYTEIG